MKLISMKVRGETKVGVLVAGNLIDLRSLYTRYLEYEEHGKNAGEISGRLFPSDMVEVIRKGKSTLSIVERMIRYVEPLLQEPIAKELRAKGIIRPFNPNQILAPIPTPRKNIVCLAVNYKAHLEEAARARGEEPNLPSDPIFFSKPPTSVTGPFSDVIKPRVTEALDYEVELAFIVGKEGKYIPETQVWEHIFGYMVFNDFTARDLQRRHRQFLRGKGLDTFAPCGPFLVTADEISDPHNLDLSLTVNGEPRQSSNTGSMIFKIPQIINILSSGMTLQPGDIVATGTPEGVGSARTPPVFLQPGDIVETTVEKIGTMKNKIVLEN
jgi:2-keto-4-pentenoate hydratase/2-oxohepta-3-ene-1,7-dioic acid hydratase in catechol pathway